jgi:hypothetical protein
MFGVDPQVLIADSQSLVQAVLSEGRTPLFSASESNGESIEQLQAIVLRLQAEHAAQYHEAQREIERLRYACADQQMAPVLQAVELQVPFSLHFRVFSPVQISYQSLMSKY